MKTAILIPARMGSTRLPGKPLLDKTGKPLIQHTYEQAKKVKGVDYIAVATDDQKIAAKVRAFGGNAIMTSAHHTTGSARIGEAAKQIPFEATCIINLQGDEPEINPNDIEALIKTHHRTRAFATTMATKFPADTSNSVNPDDPSTVKVVLGEETHQKVNTALYFSRAKIPFLQNKNREDDGKENYFLHIGIYAYSAESLQKFNQMPTGVLEQMEQLEQLRILEMNETIAVLKVPLAHPGIDTVQDYQSFVKRYKSKENI